MNRAFAAALVGAALLVSCGDDDDSDDSAPSADQAAQVADDYMEALLVADTATACDLQTASSQEEAGDCTLHSHGQVVPQLPDADPPVVSGDRANVLITGTNGTATLNLVNEGGEWKVEEYQGQPK